MDVFERDALEVLSLVRSIKNSFAPINWIPPEILSLAPDYYDEDIDRHLITLTHVCRSWRNAFISRSSLWTRLDFTNVDKTRTYLRRSKSSPLELYLERNKSSTYLNNAFFLAAPHIHRLKSLTIHGDVLPDAIRHFYCHAPRLEKLDINLSCLRAPAFDSALFKGDLSSLRELSLVGVVRSLPWNGLANLTTFKLKSSIPGLCSVTRLLNFFECAPLPHTITLVDSTPTSSNAPAGRIVSLPRLNALYIIARPPHSILLNHLRIPTGASLVLRLSFSGGKSPLQYHLPETSTNLKNLSRITTINLCFSASQKNVRLSGPSGELYVIAGWEDETVTPRTMDHRILRSLSPSILLTTQRLAISGYKPPKPDKVEKCPVFRTLSSMHNLRTLILTKCHNLPFILALNPEKNPSELVLCPNLDELVLYVKSRDQFHIKRLLNMTEERGSRGVRLSSITIVGLDELVPGKEVFKLREHVARVDYRVDDVPPHWDVLPCESSDENE